MKRLGLLAAPLLALGGLGLAACHTNEAYYVCDASMPNTSITRAETLADGWKHCEGVNDSYGYICWEAEPVNHSTRLVRGESATCPL